MLIALNDGLLLATITRNNARNMDAARSSTPHSYGCILSEHLLQIFLCKCVQSTITPLYYLLHRILLFYFWAHVSVVFFYLCVRHYFVLIIINK